MLTTKYEETKEIPKPSREWNKVKKKKGSLNSKAMNAYFVLWIKKNLIEF